MFRGLPILVAVVLCLGFAPAPFRKPPPPDPTPAEWKKLQGNWVRVRYYANGGALHQDGNTTVVVSGKGMTYLTNGQPNSYWTITLNARTSPPILDLHGQPGPGGTQAFLGVYRLEKDTLFLCARQTQDPAQRPAKIDQHLAGVLLEVFERRKP